MTALFPRGTKLTGISHQHLSRARELGGAVGDVACLMLASPERATRVVEYLDAIARKLRDARGVTLHDAMRAEQHADGAEDEAQTDVLINPTRENLWTYIQKADEEIARLQDARDAALRLYEEMERA